VEKPIAMRAMNARMLSTLIIIVILKTYYMRLVFIPY